VTQPSESLYLLYHELRPRRSDYSYVVETTAFERQCDLFLKLRGRKEPGLSPEVTFDDGHVSNFEFALPILHARAIQAWFFITVGWTGQRPHYMDWQQLRTLHEAGQKIGAHGWTHTLLTHCRPAELQKELAEARLTLEDKLGTSITTMSLSIPKREPRPAGAMIGRLNIRGDMTLEWLERLFEPKSNVLSSLARQHRIKTVAKSLLGDSLYEKLWGLVNRQEPETHMGDATAREDSAHHQ
jgi:hypothetical protein